MKLAVLAAFFAFIVVVSAKPPPEFSEKKCSSSKDCSENECCITTGFLGIMKGDCKPLSQKGDDCNPWDETIGPFKYKKYQHHCPCAEYLSCEPTEVQDLGSFGKIMINERCVSIADPTDETTTSVATTGTEEVTKPTEITEPEENETVTPEEEMTHTATGTRRKVTETEDGTETDTIDTRETTGWTTETGTMGEVTEEVTETEVIDTRETTGMVTARRTDKTTKATCTTQPDRLKRAANEEATDGEIGMEICKPN